MVGINNIKTTIYAKIISNLIKPLNLVVYNSYNNAHHSTYRVGGLFLLG